MVYNEECKPNSLRLNYKRERDLSDAAFRSVKEMKKNYYIPQENMGFACKRIQKQFVRAKVL